MRAARLQNAFFEVRLQLRTVGGVEGESPWSKPEFQAYAGNGGTQAGSGRFASDQVHLVQGVDTACRTRKSAVALEVVPKTLLGPLR